MYPAARPLPLWDRWLWLPALATGMRLASSGTANVSYLVLAAYALFGRAQAVQALALVWLFNLLGYGIAPSAPGASLGRYAVLFAAALSVFLRSRWNSSGQLSPRIGWTLALGLFFVVHSAAFSFFPDISILKSISWTMAMTTLIAAWSGLTMPQRDRLSRQLLIGMILVLIVSLPLLGSPLGYLRNGVNFQGIFGHPQAFGAFAALLCAWGIGLILGERQPSWTWIALVGVSLALVVASGARTGGFAMLFGVIIAILMVRHLSGLPVRVVMPAFQSRRFWLVVGMTLIGGIAAAPMLQTQIADYLNKGRAQDLNLVNAYQDSRGGQMERMWENIKIQPLTGIGFGVDSEYETMDITRDPLLGLPIGATIEKGVLPLAIVEEVGLLGFLFVTAWIWMLLRRSANAGIAPLAVVLTALLLNLGEAALFSPGGVGLLSLILLGWGLSSSRFRGFTR